MIDTLAYKNKPNLDTNEIPPTINVSSGRKSPNEGEDFSSAYDSDAMEIKNAESKFESSTKILPMNSYGTKNPQHQIENIMKRGTIQEVSEDKEIYDTPLVNVLPAYNDVKGTL